MNGNSCQCSDSWPPYTAFSASCIRFSPLPQLDTTFAPHCTYQTFTLCYNRKMEPAPEKHEAAPVIIQDLIVFLISTHVHVQPFYKLVPVLNNTSKIFIAICLRYSGYYKGPDTWEYDIHVTYL